MSQNTYIHKPEQAGADRRWHIIDAKGRVLGRMATEAANLLRGKHKPTYTTFVDCGDYVVITNAAHIRLTGQKAVDKFYFSHSGYAGGAKVTTFKQMMAKDPRKVVYLAVKRMLSKNRLSGRQLTRLRIYPGDKQPHGLHSSQAVSS
ncbi:MAG: 50S ribosomal protein L13 [Elusimicrobia bacterium]|nr:50S ribosomal protein L13 [Elusimicrobiota bacterium]